MEPGRRAHRPSGGRRGVPTAHSYGRARGKTAVGPDPARGGAWGCIRAPVTPWSMPAGHTLSSGMSPARTWRAGLAWRCLAAWGGRWLVRYSFNPDGSGGALDDLD